MVLRPDIRALDPRRFERYTGGRRYNMAIKKKTLSRGAALGLEPSEGESEKAFAGRVRKAEAAAKNPAPAAGGWRRF